MREKEIFEELLARYPALESCKREIWDAYRLLERAYESKGKCLIAGNGGSSGDAGHMTGELMKGFLKKRELTGEERRRLEAGPFRNGEGRQIAGLLQRALPALDLTSQGPLLTAFANDVSPDLVFAQQVYGYGCPEKDVFVGFSTSGNSLNVVRAAQVAESLGIAAVGITGMDGGELGRICRVCIRIPERETFLVQELTLPVYHGICAMLEEHFF